jgi:hypothetical protein
MIFFASDSAAPFRVVCHVSVTRVVDTVRNQDRRSFNFKTIRMPVLARPSLRKRLEYSS